MKSSSFRVLFAAHDRGGLNLLVPLMHRWHKVPGIEIVFLGLPQTEYELSRFVIPGLRTIDTRGLAVTDAEFALRAFEAERWDIAITGTGIESNLERTIWSLARHFGVRSFAYCDMWSAYELRFFEGSRRVIPDTILVLDDRMRVSAINRLGDDVSVEVVGSTLYADLLISAKKRFHFQRNKIRFISEPVSTFFPEAGIVEFEVGERFLSELEYAEIGDALIRLHPRENIESWRRFLYHFRDTYRATMDPDPTPACLYNTKFAVGISSMMLLEMSLMGIPVASLRTPGADSSYYCLPESDAGIAVLETESDLRHWVAKPEPLPISPGFVDHHQRAFDCLEAIALDDRRRRLVTSLRANSIP